MTQPNDGQSDPNDGQDPTVEVKPEPFVPPPEMQGKRAVARAAREHKAAQKKAAAKKAPAKKTPAKKASNVVQIGRNAARPKGPQDADHPWYTRKSYTAVPGQKLYEAVGESGQIAVRSCANPVTHAISWAHVDQPGERAKAIREGVIANFYPSEGAAERQAAKFRADNPEDRIVVVPAREYRGQ